MCSNDSCWEGPHPLPQSKNCRRTSFANGYNLTDDDNNNADVLKTHASMLANEKLESSKKILDKGPLYLRQRIFNRDSGFYSITLIVIVHFVQL